MISEDMNSMMYSSAWDATDNYYSQEPNDDFVLESWLTGQDPSTNGTFMLEEDDDMMVDVDFNDSEEVPPTPPAGRLLLEVALADTLAAAANQGDDDEASFYSQRETSPILASSTNLTSFLPAEQRYEATLEKLRESMKRSQETRMSLRMQTAETAEYDRWTSISGTLSSIEKSTQQLQDYLNNQKPAQDN